MGVTDCHVHLNPIWQMHPRARALIGHGGAGVELEAYARSPQKFLDYLDHCGVERAVLVNYVAPEIVGYTEQANDFVSEYCRADPRRLIAIGSVLPSHPDPGEEVERLVGTLGIRGLKIHPSHQLFAPNDYVHGHQPGLRAIYAACERLGKAGVKIPRPAGPMAHGGSVIAFIEDPDGYKIELIERK